MPARCSRRLCHTSSDEGAEGFRTRRSVVESSRGLRSLTQQEDAAQATQGSCRKESDSRIGTKKLDLKSNCATSTPYIVLQRSHN